jgi:hypothetical protein
LSWLAEFLEQIVEVFKPIGIITLDAAEPEIMLFSNSNYLNE